MIRSRLVWEIVLPYAAFALLATTGLVWLGGSAYERSERSRLSDRLAAAAQGFASHPDVFLTPAGVWRADLDRLAAATGNRFTVLAADGTPLADTSNDAALLGSFKDSPEVRNARASGTGESLSNEGSRLAVAVAVRDADEAVIGFVRAESDAAPVAAAANRWRRWAALAAAAVATLGALVAGRTAVRLAKPVETLTQAAASVAGTGGSLPRLGTGRALAPLSTALAEMTRELGDRVDRLGREKSALESEVSRLTAILTGMADGVLAVDREDRILFANPAAAQLLDLPDGKLVGRPLWEAVRLPAIQETAKAALAAGTTRQIELELPRTQTTLAVRVGCLPGDTCPGVVIVLHDLTELRRLENLRREFVSNVSHELKTPLASIQAYAETLLEGAIDDREYATKFLGRIGEQADRLHNLILDLLRLARIEAGNDVFEIRKLSAANLIEPSVEEHLAVAKTKGVTLQANPPAEPVRLRADPEGFRTILDNLLDNAINYTPAGGRVAVRWGRADGMAMVEVADTGIGIPEEHLPRVFERFHRVDKARSRDHGGTGLGLAIVKHLVQVFEGRVEVESRVGEGTTFRIYLPAA